MIRPILRWPDPVLAQVCAPVEAIDEDIRTLAADMLETMYDAPGRGLAASQVGVLHRMFVMDVAWKDGSKQPMICINPDVTPLGDGDVTSDEGCLSIPDLMVPVRRPEQVEMSWTDLDGVRHTKHFDGFAALCIQHETDHLNGVVTLDRVDPALRAGLIATYEGAQ